MAVAAAAPEVPDVKGQESRAGGFFRGTPPTTTTAAPEVPDVKGQESRYTKFYRQRTTTTAAPDA